MSRWHVLAAAAAAVVGAASLGVAVRSHESTDQEMELTAAQDTLTGAGSFAFTVAATPIEDLYPGAVRQLRLTLTNPLTVDLTVTGLHADLVATSNPGCEPSAANLEVQPYTGRLPITVRARGSKPAGLVPLYMPNTVANECQRATFTIKLSAEAARSSR